ncbi:MAG: hypothetical protein GY711_04470 [bacterium]|nr:hypothetical protein [bacterium]
MIHAATWLLSALALAPPQTQGDERRAYPFEVTRVGSLDTPRLTIRADNAPIERVMLKVAHELGRELKGFDAIMRRPDITARLEGEPAKNAVRWVLGSVNMRAVIDQHEIYVMEDVSAFPDPEELLKRANTRYLRALIDFPDFRDADHAEFARGQVNEALGGEFTSDAIYSYDSLVENYPRSVLAPDALYRAARLLRTQGDNEGAALRYERLAELESGHELHADARIELALSLCKLAEETRVDGARLDRAHKALYVLDALDDRIVTRTDQERRARLLVRARALALTEKPIDALKALDLAARYSQSGQNDSEMLELRAMALSRAGEHGASSTAWLAYAREQTGDELVRAYVNAAEEALRGGHELATIAIEAQARARGFGDALAVPAGEARARLGLIEKSATELDLMQRIRRGERFLQNDDIELAVQALRPVHAQRGALADEGTVRLAEAYAQALDKNGMFVDAIGVLRTAAGELGRVTDRRRIYILASELYERHGHWDKAVDAIQGKL